MKYTIIVGRKVGKGIVDIIINRSQFGMGGTVPGINITFQFAGGIWVEELMPLIFTTTANIYIYIYIYIYY